MNSLIEKVFVSTKRKFICSTGLKELAYDGWDCLWRGYLYYTLVHIASFPGEAGNPHREVGMLRLREE
ncbi:hypothetical protein B6F84_00345 [Acidianus manzaensis]|uniref:Uncharacterized protein n=1 Tax=Acidianus manzaensis TaxID=282676 RepID=A0A1W6JWN1_9CREN|nr:hypothetical protein B6F84_00345 [Acidianus manzaensis]